MTLLLIAYTANAINTPTQTNSPQQTRLTTPSEALSCTCSGPSTTDLFRSEFISCGISLSRDYCINSTSVRQYYCNGTRVSSQTATCPTGYLCSAGACSNLPDLELTRLEILPPKTRTLKYVSAIAFITNVGATTSPPTNVTLYWTCEPLTKTIGPLTPGNSTQIVYQNTLIFDEGGIYPVTGLADSAYQINESREDNNQLIANVTVELPGQIQTPNPPTDLHDEEERPISCTETPMMQIGRKKNASGNYYADAEGRLLRPLSSAPWDGAPPSGHNYLFADFDYNYDASSQTLNLTDTTNASLVTNRYWILDDGYTSNSINIIHSIPRGMHNISLTVTDNRGYNATVTKRVDLSYGGVWGPKVNFIFEHNKALQFTFFDYSGRGVATSLWNLGDGQISNYTNPIYTYSHPGNYTITYTITDSSGVTQTVTRTIQADTIWLPGQGHTNACGTTTLAYTLRYITGRDYTPATIDSAIRASSAASSFGDDAGMFTDPISMIEYARRQGVNAEIYQNGDFTQIRRLIDQGHPVILDISAKGDTDINNGHWLVVVAYCSRPTETPGAYETVYGVYNPWGYQYEIEESRLAKYWGPLELGGFVPLWTRLYVLVSNNPLPPGDTENIRAKLAVGQSLTMMTTGAEHLASGDVGGIPQGLIEMVGGTVTGIVGALSEVIFGFCGHADDVPLVGGFLTATDQLVGSVMLSANQFLTDLGSDVAYLVDNFYNPLAWGETLVNLVSHVLTLVGNIIENVLDFIVNVFEAIGRFFTDLWHGIEDFFCWITGSDCTKRTCVIERMVSTDGCGETSVYMNKMFRVGAAGYVGTKSSNGTVPIYKYVQSWMGSNNRWTYISLNPNADANTTDAARTNTLGYVKTTPCSGCVNLTSEMPKYNLEPRPPENLGFIPKGYENDSTPLWLFNDTAGGSITVSTDACAGTRTFVSPVMDGYTRTKLLGYIRLTYAPDTVKVYRYYNKNEKAFFLSLNPNETNRDYVMSGLLGYAYTTNSSDTTPLSSYLPAYFTQQNASATCENDESTYTTSVGNIYKTKHPCTVPVYKYCKRYIKVEE
ncbi:Peptidase_C39 like family protein [uncultured archaeon]|nr:Peptidase_C39 like family protein [uncultured archaeon]